jgi:hypothetical protein
MMRRTTRLRPRNKASCGGNISELKLPTTRKVAPTIFWGPMAYAITGGLLIVTVLIFMPALYVTWFGLGSRLIMRTDQLCLRQKRLTSP